MGRVKLKIKKLESSSSRQVTYSKRKNGILKKARELAILCDIDIVLLMFSPTSKPTLYQGERSNIEEVITKFVQLTPQERAKRKLEGLDGLKRIFKKFGHDVNIKDFVGSRSQDFEELTDEVSVLRDHIADSHKKLSYWKNLHNINNIELLQQMEDLVRESLNQTRPQGKCKKPPSTLTGLHKPVSGWRDVLTFDNGRNARHSTPVMASQLWHSTNYFTK